MELEERIPREALELFVANGIKAVSMDDVARAAGISKRTLYEHFDSKDALLAACIRVMVYEKEVSLDNILTDAQSFFDVFTKTVYQGMQQMVKVNPLFLQDLKRYNFQTANEALQQRKSAHYGKLVQLINDGKAKGLIIEELNSEMIARMMTDLPPFSPRRLAQEGQWPIMDVMLQIIKIFLRGIATEAGYVIVSQALNDIEDENRQAAADAEHDDYVGA